MIVWIPHLLFVLIPKFKCAHFQALEDYGQFEDEILMECVPPFDVYFFNLIEI